jgi:hypothetical protein
VADPLLAQALPGHVGVEQRRRDIELAAPKGAEEITDFSAIRTTRSRPAAGYQDPLRREPRLHGRLLGLARREDAATSSASL